MLKLTLCLVTKNNENSLRRCFYPIQEFLYETVAIDLGSTDNTKQILNEYNARIIDFKSDNDFSAVKNRLIDEAGGDLLLFLNPDDIIFKEDMKKLMEYLAKNIKDETMAYLFYIRNYTNKTNVRGFKPDRIYGFEGYFTSEQVRLIVNNKKIRYTFAIDESLMPCLEELNATIKHIVDVPIHSYGYLINQDLLENAAENPSDIRVLYNTAMANLNIGGIQKAKGYFTKVIEKEPSYKKALFNLGAIYMGEDRLDVAAKMFTQSLEFDEKNIGAYYNLAVIFQKNRQFDKAETLFKKALSLGPDDFRIYKSLALLYIETGRKELAIKALNSAMRLNPGDRSLPNLKASLNR